MKALLFLCVIAALVHKVVLHDGYLKMKVNKHYPPLNANDYMYMVVGFNTPAMDSLFEALDDPDSSVLPDDKITIFTDSKWLPINSFLETVPKDFSSPQAAMSSVNTFVKDKTSGKINNLVENVNENTAAILVNTNNAWKVPSEGGNGWTKQLNGNYKMVENKDMGITMIEIPLHSHTYALYAIPSPGREEELGKTLTSSTIEALRKSMTLQKVNMEVPRATLYTGSFMLVDIIPNENGELIKTRYGYKVSAQFP